MDTQRFQELVGHMTLVAGFLAAIAAILAVPYPFARRILMAAFFFSAIVISAYLYSRKVVQQHEGIEEWGRQQLPAINARKTLIEPLRDFLSKNEGISPPITSEIEQSGHTEVGEEGGIQESQADTDPTPSSAPGQDVVAPVDLSKQESVFDFLIGTWKSEQEDLQAPQSRCALSFGRNGVATGYLGVCKVGVTMGDVVVISCKRSLQKLFPWRPKSDYILTLDRKADKLVVTKRGEATVDMCVRKPH